MQRHRPLWQSDTNHQAHGAVDNPGHGQTPIFATAGMADAGGKASAAGDIDLAAYLFARSVVGREVGEAEFNLLYRINNSIELGRRYFDGRCNVRSDRAKAKFNTWRMKSAVNIVLRQVAQLGLKDFNLTPAVRAGALACYQSGACSEHAQVGAFLFAKTLQDDEILLMRKNALHDHCWILVQDLSQNLCAVYDLWCDGPAICVDDSAYENYPDNETVMVIATTTATERVQTMRKELARSACISVAADDGAREFEFGLSTVGPLLRNAIQKMFEDLETRGDDIPENALWQPEPVLAEKFAAQVNARVDTDNPEQRKLACAIANKLGMAVVDEIDYPACDILTRAGNLRTASPR